MNALVYAAVYNIINNIPWRAANWDLFVVGCVSVCLGIGLAKRSQLRVSTDKVCVVFSLYIQYTMIRLCFFHMIIGPIYDKAKWLK